MSPVAVTPVACPNSAIARSNHASLKSRGPKNSTANVVQAAPPTIMIVSGIAWTTFAVLFFGPRLFRVAWFERAIAEFGQATGVTATGLLLLRTVDPESKTPASASFAGKQLLHEPAMNLWVALAFALIFTLGWLKVFLICAGMLTIWLIVSFVIMRRNGK